MSQLRLSQLNLWKRHEQRVIEVLLAALSLLQSKTRLQLFKLSEPKLNFEFYWCLVEANRELHRQDPRKGFDHSPMWEAQNQPNADDTPESERLKKRPDFQWGCTDDKEPDIRKSEKHFVIECKRLGKPLRRDRVFTTLYIEEGIRRFVICTHQYAKGVESSAMVGYVQNMELGNILYEVNTTAANNPGPITQLQLSAEGWQENGISELEHELTRQFPIKSFRLYHFWVDLRRDK